MLTILNEYNKTDYVKEFKNTWRIFDGLNWRFAFSDKEKAKRFAKQFKGEAVGYAIKNGENLAYREVELIDG